MDYNFDEVIERNNTNCLKYDASVSRFGTTDIMPLWVADMDFRVCPEITERFSQIIKHGIYGYNLHSERYFNAIKKWFSDRHGMNVNKHEICFTPGVVPAISYIVQVLTEKGDGVMVQSPVYYPFFSIVEQNGRKLLINQLIEDNNKYFIDFDDFEIQARQSKLFILCSPHNPVGRVWRKDELKKITDICLKHNVIIVSDEIHNDLVFNEQRHTSTATISDDVKNITITCHAASKTFNLAGLSTAYIIVHNSAILEKFKTFYSTLHADALNTFGLEAMTTAYEKGLEWHNQSMQYIWNNYLFLKEFLSIHLPEIKVTPLEATYLVWLDFRKYKLTDIELKKIIIEKAKLGLNDGPSFGPGGSGFQRVNIACPRSVLKKALERLRDAFEYDMKRN